MSRKWKDYTPLLNEYQYTSDPNYKGFPLGTEYSHDYSHNKESYLLISDEKSQLTVSLKAFIRDFSITFNYTSEDQRPIGGHLERTTKLGFIYDFSLDVPALSVDDAMVNAARIDAIKIMMDKTSGGSTKKTTKPTTGTTGESQTPPGPATTTPPASTGQTHEQKLVLLSNLIHNGNYTKQVVIRNYAELSEYALRCYLEKFTFKPNLEMGFFEYAQYDDNSLLFPKVYEVSFSLIANPLFNTKPKAKAKRIISHFTGKPGKIEPNEFTSDGTWPFGVKTIK